MSANRAAVAQSANAMSRVAMLSACLLLVAAVVVRPVRSIMEELNPGEWFFVLIKTGKS